ncbi:MAG: Peptidoglycan glycosyltransferase [Parcubacteria group bacterium GW2011_GWB1_45_9]|nr:MAG: Peptidoglycan glycosyltransferase [Parcubacteria group bacterium GW2011_GWB1_45_9]
MAARFSFLIICFFAFYSALVWNLYNIQIEKGNYYVGRALAQNEARGFFDPKRGRILFTDKNKNFSPAAINREKLSIFAAPKEIEDVSEAAHILAPIFGLEPTRLEARFLRENSLYELLDGRPSEELVKEIKEFNLRGIYIGTRLSRYYPLGELGAHLLGFIAPTAEDDNFAGRYGLETYYEERLAGKSGEITGERLLSPVHGDDLVLTIDPAIQERASAILEKLIKDYRAEGGTVMVQNPSTGAILAMHSEPSFDPNEYYKFSFGHFTNPVVEAVYEPGSIFKVITMAIGLDAGKITPDTTYFDGGSVTYNTHTIRNWDLKAHGTITMTQVLENSVNTGAVFAERQVGHENFLSYLKKFGFDSKTEVDLPGEVAGNLKNLDGSSRDINFANASFGQGVAVTSLNLLRAISTIANGGVMARPYLNAELQPKNEGRIISEGAAKQTVDMMVSAVDKARVAAIPYYSVAGKTGTAQVPDLKRGGYTKDVINTYIGFAPAYNPQAVVFIRLDKPYGAPLAGLTVVPSFRELMEFVLNYYNVSPDRL